MVTIVGYSLKTNIKGVEFYTLILQGGIAMVKSKTSDLIYATAVRCGLPSTFDLQTCKSMVGEKLPGTIIKKNCDPYRFIDRETGEEITKNYRYVYLPEAASPEEAIYEGVPEGDVLD